MRYAQNLLLVIALTTTSVQAANLWGTTWGESFNSVKSKFPDAEILDEASLPHCKGIIRNFCNGLQVILKRNAIADLPSEVIFQFNRERQLIRVGVMLSEAGKYTPARLGIALEQVTALLEKEHGKPLERSQLKLVPAPGAVSKSTMDGSATVVWHTKEMAISADIVVMGAESEAQPPRFAVFAVRYSPLKPIGK